MRAVSDARTRAAIRRCFVATVALACGLAWSGVAVAGERVDVSSRPGDDVTIRRFDAALRARPSASSVLTSWCRARGLMAPGESLRATVFREASAPSAFVRRMLRVSRTERVGYRHVRLSCGRHVVSDARNWFVVALLTPAMRRELATTDRPFGIVVRALHFERRRIATRFFPDGRRRIGEDADAPPGTVMQHLAILTVARDRPLSFVIENYRRAVLASARRDARARSYAN